MYFTGHESAVHVRSYTALESIRVASQLLTVMGEAEPTEEQDAYGQKNQCEIDRASLDLVAGALQERVYAARLAIPESTFTVIRRHQNGWPGNYPGIEGVVTALTIAVDQLDRALDLFDDEDLDEDDESLYALLLGAFALVRSTHGYLNSIVAGFDEDAAMKAACAGRPIPAYNRYHHAERILAAV